MSRRLAVQATGLFTRSGGRPRHSQTHQPGMTLQSVCIEQPSVLVESRNFCPGRPGTAVPGQAPLGNEDHARRHRHLGDRGPGCCGSRRPARGPLHSRPSRPSRPSRHSYRAPFTAHGIQDPLQNGGGPSNEIGFGFRVSFEQRIRDSQRRVGLSSSDPMARSPVAGSVFVLASSSLAKVASGES